VKKVVVILPATYFKISLIDNNRCHGMCFCEKVEQEENDDRQQQQIVYTDEQIF
jgi:hypothetical protein